MILNYSIYNFIIIQKTFVLNIFLTMNKHLIFFILLLVFVIGSCNASPLNWIFTRRIISNRNKNPKKKNILNEHNEPKEPKNSNNLEKTDFLQSKK